MRVILVMLATFTASAQTVVVKPGCYRFQGRIVHLDHTRLSLLIHEGSSDAETLPIELTGDDTFLIKGSRVEMVASVKTAGKLALAGIAAERSQIKIVPSGAAGPDLTGGWVGVNCR